MKASSISSSSSSSDIKESPEKDFEVTFQGDTATIKKYVGDSAVVRVPSKIQGVTVTKIGELAFAGRNLSKIKEIVLPDTIKIIDHCAFREANNLTQINIPNSVVKILGHTQITSQKLKKLIIPASVQAIGIITSNCYELEKIEVDPANEFYTSVDGVLYDKEITNLINIPAGLKLRTLKVPPTVNKIGVTVMRGSQLKEIQIPKNAEVDPKAFNGANCRVVRY
jgi:hypothetical protein